MEIRHETEVARPPEAVFDFLADTDSFAVLDRALVSCGPRGVMQVGLHGTFVFVHPKVTGSSPVGHPTTPHE